MGRKPEDKPQEERKGEQARHLQFPQESWTEIDAEGSDSEMSQGRQSDDPFYTPLATEAAERKLREKRAAEARLKKDTETQGGEDPEQPDEQDG
ncbi:MAG: hypothetical protein ACOX87_09645 [Chloroflexota bacterium]|jgi:hypothetical protein